jgi:hypothetical protein
MTIDQLLADVTPLLPDIGCIFPHHWDADLRYKAAVYSRHAANHFPAMLQALREIAELGQGKTCFDAMDIASEALAAAEVCE